MPQLKVLNARSYKSFEGTTIDYSVEMTCYGLAFIGFLQDQLCFMHLLESPRQAPTAKRELKSVWPRNTIQLNSARVKSLLQRAGLVGERVPSHVRLKLITRGTEFQATVWKALIKVPKGRLVSYSSLARSIKRPTAVRAVANAVGKNHLGGVVPCHRVIRSSGHIGGFGWGVPKKAWLIEVETGQKLNS